MINRGFRRRSVNCTFPVENSVSRLGVSGSDETLTRFRAGKSRLALILATTCYVE